MSVESAIREGGLGSGDSLPTVRALAAALGTSPATVNSAYRILRQRGLVFAAGRRGTHVAPRPALRAPQRSGGHAAPQRSGGQAAPQRAGGQAAPQRAGGQAAASQMVAGRRDLTIGLANPALLPPIGPALARIDLDEKLRLGALEMADPELLEVAAASFACDGVPADAIAVVAGALDGIERVLQAHLLPGDRVVIEDPAYPPIRDILLALGLLAVPVEVDDCGPLPDRFEAALAAGAHAVVIVPRAQNPLGSALDSDRSAELRALLARSPDVLVVEDDHAAVVSGAPYFSLIAPDWPRWAVLRTMSKILHPDLRLALMAADETTIARVEGRQALGPRWVSHILQAATAGLLRDPQFGSIADRARETYSARRAGLIAALADAGIAAYGRSGLNVWVPVREEAATVGALLDRGWLVLAGERFRISTPPGIRVTIATLEQDEAVELARDIAAAEHAGRTRRAY